MDLAMIFDFEIKFDASASATACTSLVNALYVEFLCIIGSNPTSVEHIAAMCVAM